MAQMAELLLACLDAVGARSVTEVGAFAGDLTRVLAQWAAGAGARVKAIDPAPQESLVRLADERPELELVRETSLEALTRLPTPDVPQLLARIAELSPGSSAKIKLWREGKALDVDVTIGKRPKPG